MHCTSRTLLLSDAKSQLRTAWRHAHDACAAHRVDLAVLAGEDALTVEPEALMSGINGHCNRAVLVYSLCK